MPHRIWVGRLLFLIMVLVGSSYHFLVPASSSIEVMTTSRKNYRWAIVTTTNKSFLDFFLNWLSHYESLGLDVAVYVIAEDRATNETLQCIDGINVVDTELDLEGGTFGSDGYKTLVSKRPGQILQVWGLTPTEVDALLYVDMDTIWLDNVFPEVEESLLDHDLANPTDGRRYISKQGDFNTGFIAIPKTEWNKHFMKTWQAEIENNPQPNQPIYNQLVLSEKMRVAKLNSWHFPDGRMYYNHPWKAWAKVVHNNAIGRGHEKKKKKFVDNTLWTIKPRYKELMEVGCPSN